MGSRVERICRARQRTTQVRLGEVGLAEQETKDSELAVNYCGGCHGGRNSPSHTTKLARVEQACHIVPLSSLPDRQHHNLSLIHI